MPRSTRTTDRLTLIGAVASVAIAIAGIAGLRDGARVVDVITATAGGLGTVASLAAVIIRRRRAARSSPLNGRS